MKKRSSFISSLGLMIGLNVIVKPIWILGIDRMVQNSVGTISYGNYFSLFGLSVVFSFLLDWGFSVYFNRQLAAQEKDFIDQAGNFLLIKFFFLSLYVAVILFIGWITGVRDWGILLGVIFIQALQSFFLFFRSIITACQWFRFDAWLSVLDKTLMIILCGSLLYFPSFFGAMSIDRFLQIQIACSLLAVFTAWIVILKKGVKFTFHNNYLLRKKIFRSALPFAFIILLMSVHYRLDGFLLGRIHKNGAYEAGIYASAYRLLDAANMVGALIATFLLPYIARQWSDKKDITAIVLTCRHFLVLFSISIASVSFFLAPWILQILYHQETFDAMRIMQWCLPSLIGYSLVQVYGTVMTATGKIVHFCYITLIAVIINSTLNFLLIPSWGALGCCMAALISQGFCGISVMLYVWKRSAIPLDFRSLIINIFTIVILAFFLYWGKNFGINPYWLVMGVLLISGIAFLISGTRQWRPWLKLFRMKEYK